MRFFLKRTPCNRVVLLINRRVDDALPRKLEGAVEHHVRACSGCRREQRVMDRLVHSLDQLDRQAPTKDLWEGISRGISRPPLPWYQALVAGNTPLWGPSEKSSWRRSAPLLVTVTVALLVSFNYLWPRGSSPSFTDSTALFMMRPAPVRVVPTPYFTQAEEASFFEPLADRASLGEVIEVSSHVSTGLQPHGVRIMNVMGSSGQ